MQYQANVCTLILTEVFGKGYKKITYVNTMPKGAQGGEEVNT
jgi:hypothetical protein